MTIQRKHTDLWHQIPFLHFLLLIYAVGFHLSLVIFQLGLLGPFHYCPSAKGFDWLRNIFDNWIRQFDILVSEQLNVQNVMVDQKFHHDAFYYIYFFWIYVNLQLIDKLLIKRTQDNTWYIYIITIC